MRSELRCEDVRVELSARLDGEVDAGTAARVDEHLRSCAACRAHETALQAVRRSIRLHAFEEEVPDLTAAVMRRIHTEPRASSGRDVFRFRVRIAAVAAAAAALVVFGATLPLDTRGDVATATEISDNVRAAARALGSYEASFTIIERGWHPEVDARELDAQVWFRAPEDIHVRVEDRTSYPSKAWPTNDYELIANASRLWIEERSACPTQGLPACPRPYITPAPIEQRSVVRRQPFDGTTPLPTDVVVPLSTLTSATGVEVVGTTALLGRPAVQVRMDHRRALPLVSAFQVGGSWREFHPLDPVDVWLDRETWFPLRYEVRTGTSPDRSLWAVRRSLDDVPGELLLRVVAHSFEITPQLSDSLFAAPRSGLVRDGRFHARGAAGGAPIEVPSGLRPYRAGRLGGHRVWTYSDGLTYLKVTSGPADAADIPPEAEELETALGFVYYQPATYAEGRRIDIIGDRRHVALISNLTRDELIDIASSAELRGRRAPTVVRRSGDTVVTRAKPRAALAQHAFALEPSILPEGYRSAASLVTSTGRQRATVTVYYRHPEIESEGMGIRIVQSSRVSFLPPSSEEFFDVEVDGVVGRWSPERGELEWISASVYRAVAVPSGDLATALSIAEGLD